MNIVGKANELKVITVEGSTSSKNDINKDDKNEDEDDSEDNNKKGTLKINNHHFIVVDINQKIR